MYVCGLLYPTALRVRRFTRFAPEGGAKGRARRARKAMRYSKCGLLYPIDSFARTRRFAPPSRKAMGYSNVKCVDCNEDWVCVQATPNIV